MSWGDAYYIIGLVNERLKGLFGPLTHLEWSPAHGQFHGIDSKTDENCHAMMVNI